MDLRYEDLGQDTLTPLDISFIEVEGELDSSGGKLTRPLILRRGAFGSVVLDDAQFVRRTRKVRRDVVCRAVRWHVRSVSGHRSAPNRAVSGRDRL